MKVKGNLSKMRTNLADPIEYHLHLGGQSVAMNKLLGQRIKIHYHGHINCIACGEKITKAFGQGFCYNDFMNSPMNSECIIRPVLCQAHEGIGRDPEWEEKYHNQPHLVYLALTSEVKVGVTRIDQVPTRWIDQGAWKAIRFAEVPYRALAGEIEIFLKEFISDKTHWQRMLRDIRDEEEDLIQVKDELLDELGEDLGQYYAKSDFVTELTYPVLEYPEKVSSMNLDKTPDIEGELRGIRGQYLILDGGRVINVRKFSGYYIDLEVVTEAGSDQNEELTLF